ncbi:Protein TAB2-like protein chloroplastic, partial [Bienertia sinuspersici]
MATLSFNPTKFRDQTTSIPYKPISNFTSFFNPPKFHLISSVSESSISSPIEETQTIGDEDEEVEVDPTAEMSFLDPGIEPESIIEWELDFCSRPILDIRGKKDLGACCFITLKNAIVSICDELGLPLPEKIRFFRSQLQTIITKACTEL